MNRAEQRERTRHALVMAAAEEFETHGYANTSLSDVAAKLGLVRGTVHFHFQTKQALATAVVERFTTQWASWWTQSETRTDGTTRSLIWLSHQIADSYSSDPCTRASIRLITEDDGLGMTCAQAADDWTSYVERRLADTASTGELGRPVHPRLEATTLVAVLTGVLASPATGAGETLRMHIDHCWERLGPGSLG